MQIVKSAMHGYYHRCTAVQMPRTPCATVGPAVSYKTDRQNSQAPVNQHHAKSKLSVIDDSCKTNQQHQQACVSTAYISVLITGHSCQLHVVHNSNTAHNSSDNLPSYLQTIISAQTSPNWFAAQTSTHPQILSVGGDKMRDECRLLAGNSKIGRSSPPSLF